MKQRKVFAKATLAVALAIFSSTAAMGQQESDAATVTKPSVNITKNGRVEFSGGRNNWLGELASRIKLHGYAQAGYNYTNRDGDETNTFEIKRVLFWADARITDRWSFCFMHDFSSVVQEFYTDFRITKNKALNFRLGQFKNGLSLENPLSPTAMETIDVYSEGVTFLSGCGSDPLLGVQYGRDLGLSIYGETNNAKLRYEVDVMNGQGINKKDGNNFKDIISRIEYRPAKGLNIVATGQVGRGHSIADTPSPYNPTIRKGEDYMRNRSTIGADYKSKAFNVHGEYLNGWDGDAHSWGAYVTGAVPLGVRGLELVASYDFFNYNTDLDLDQHKAVGGLQYWFFGKCRVQVQYVYKSAYTAEGRFVHGDNHGIQCQMQVRFN